MAQIKSTFEVVGAITRSTVSAELVDPLEDVLHWIWSWRTQLNRLTVSTEAQGQGNTPVEKRQSYSRASFDEHMLAVTGWNLTRALNAAQPRLPTTELAQRTSDALRLLRNLYEHWDTQRGSFQSTSTEKIRSGAEFSRSFPEGRPWSITYGETDWFLGGVLAIGELTRQLRTIEQEILTVQRQGSP
jgi:hypothetical protein